MQELIDQEKTLEAEIRELESRSTLLENPVRDYDCNFAETHLQDFSDNNDMRSKKFKQMDYSTRVQHYPIEVLEMKVTWMGEKTVVVCITCSKKRETMVQLCKVLESLNLNILTTNFSSFTSRLSTTLFLQVTLSLSPSLISLFGNVITSTNYKILNASREYCTCLVLV
ncbi:hypothetical protein AXX17_AT4G34330 [Arabidopsis thaliana]|nr:hypothetical protein AXX17_AT4G34330 [Arabidopsis thaliana]